MLQRDEAPGQGRGWGHDSLGAGTGETSESSDPTTAEVPAAGQLDDDDDDDNRIEEV